MPKVLLVDDEPNIVMLIKSRLTANNFEVVTASDGLQAMEKLKKEDPDLVIVDVLMPKMTGYEFVQEIKRHPGKNKEIPIIVISARKNMSEFFNSWDVYTFLPKPFDGGELMKHVRKALHMEDQEEVQTVQKDKSAAGSAKKILLIAYREFILGKLKKTLEDKNMVFVAQETDEGVVEARKVLPDIIFIEFCEDPKKVDAEMIYRRLQERPTTKSIPLGVFCSDGLGIDALKTFRVSQLITYSKSDELIKKVESYISHLASSPL